MKRGGGKLSLGGLNNDFYSLSGKHKYVHTLGNILKLVCVLRHIYIKEKSPEVGSRQHLDLEQQFLAQ